MIHRSFIVIALLAIVSAGCARTHGPSVPPEIYSLGNHHFPIRTTSRAAQTAFDRGIIWMYAFNHNAAEHEFARAAELDPASPMPWWGIALVNGPHINFPLVPPDNGNRAWHALGEARSRLKNGSAFEAALITALGYRYRSDVTQERSSLDQAYAQAMRSVAAEFPSNPDALSLYAESMMDLRPWDLWTKDGKPQPETPLIIETLEHAIKLDPFHPLARHLYIHAVEASPNFERGIESADVLRTLVPGASHLVHMPAHIYARLGWWQDAEWCNIDAIKVDDDFRMRYPNPGFYAMYMAHNKHFLIFAEMMRGRKAEAVRSARELVKEIPDEFIRNFAGIADGFLVIVPEVLVRFGAWEEVLAEPQPRAKLPFSTAIWRFTRATALTALNRLSEAKVEREQFIEATKRVPADATFGNNSAPVLLTIAQKVLDGEMAARENNLLRSISLLREAAKLEDTLRYDEPPDWLQPVRHSLGAVLLRANRFDEAEIVYREDLSRFPANGWSLFGLAKSLEAQGKRDDAERLRAQFSKAWADADTKLNASCLCQP